VKFDGKVIYADQPLELSTETVDKLAEIGL